MQIEIFSICDAATDYGGRLNLLGAFEGIASVNKPIVRERCSIATRLRFLDSEVGEHSICIRFIDKEQKQAIPEMKAKLNVKVSPGRESAAVNLVLNINRLVFSEFGYYRIQLWVDEEQRFEMLLLVAKARHGRQVRGSAMEN